MKIRLFFLSLLTFLLVPISVAATCTSDVIIEMKDEIKQHGSITTIDGLHLTNINHIFREFENMCSGNGYYNQELKGKMFWAKGNWRTTIHRI